MPDVTFVVNDISDAGDAERLERALERLGAVNGASVDPERGLVAVSYEGGGAELERVESAIGDAGHEFERSPGADRAVE